MKTKRFLLGIFFLLDPNISIYDIFPDIIGYILIYSSVYKMSLVSSAMYEARDALRKMVTVSGCKILAGFLLFFLSASNAGTFDRGWHLTFTFSFALIETFYSLKAFNTLLEGLDSAWLLFGSGKGERIYNNTLMFTRLFIFVKNGLCLAAELPFLMESSTSGTIENVTIITSQNIRSVLTLFNVVICTVLGLAWILHMNSYIKRFRFTSFQKAAQEKYVNILKDDPSKLVRARLNRIFSLIKIGCFFIISFTVWNINLLPSFVFGILALCAVFTASGGIKGTDNIKVIECKMAPKIVTLLFTFVSFVQYVLTCIFYALYQSPDESLSFSDVISVTIERNTTAFVLFVLILIFTVLEAVTFVIFVRSLSSVMCKIAKIYTASKYKNKETSFKNEETYNNIKTVYLQSFAAAILVGICSVLQQTLIFTASIMWFVSMLSTILFFVLFLRATEIVSKESELRFLYE